MSWLALALVLASASNTEDARQHYLEARASLEADRVALHQAYVDATQRSERKAVLDRARARVLASIQEDLFPAWLGTQWTFSGTSETPGEGSIACGFFVGTVLAHAGFNLDRIALGRLASEHIALTLTSETNLRRYRNIDVDVVEANIAAWGPGLYAVGLDYHAGLIIVDEAKRVTFIHSTVLSPGTVVAEPAKEGANPFAVSRYRVVAKLLDDTMMRHWLEGDLFKPHTKG